MAFSQPISYKQFNGHLDPLTGNVKFYKSVYPSIIEAIQSELNLCKGKFEYNSPSIRSFRTFRTN